jgi:hypothetical protein
MAGSSSNYKILLEAQIDPSKVTAQIKAISTKNTILLNAKFDQGDLRNLNAQLDTLKKAGAELLKVTTFNNSSGGINKAAVEYLDTNKNIVKTTLQINQSVVATHKTTQNLAKDAKEYATALQNADKFLESSKNKMTSPQLSTAMDTAKNLKKAVDDGDIEGVRRLTKELDLNKAALSTGHQAMRSWTDGMKMAMRMTIEYAASVGLVYGALNQIKEGIQYISELNKEMTNIQVLQVEGAKTNEEIGDLALKYNNLAKELGVVTTEVAAGSVEWLRAGRSIGETQQLLRSTMMLSKLGALDSAQATEYLTAIVNGFNLEASESEDIVSKLISIDNIAATSSGELATAMQYSSAVAKESGVSFENLAAMVGAVSSNTRLSAEMIGTAF